MNIPSSIHKMSKCEQHDYVMVYPERYYCLDCTRNQNTPKPCIRCDGLNVIVAQGVSGCTRCDFKTTNVDSLAWMAYRRIIIAIESGVADLSDPLVQRITRIREMITLKDNLVIKLRQERENQALINELNSS